MMKLKFKYLPYALSLSISLILLGLFEFVQASFNIYNITTSAYVFNVAVPSLINVSILYTAIFMHKMYVKDHNKEITEREVKINDIINHNIDIDFGDFLYQKNKKRKISAYKIKIQKRIMRLERRAKVNDDIIFHGDNEGLKSKNKYCQRHRYLESLISDENWLDKNIQFINVKYAPLRKAQVFNDYKVHNPDDEAFENINKRIVIDTLPNWLFAFVLTAFFYSFAMTPINVALITIITFLVRLLLAIFMYFSGRHYMDDRGVKMILQNMEVRLDIFKEYFHWKIERKGNHESANL